MTARLSNLDSSRTRVVKRGCTVARDAFHYRVDRVRTGYCTVTPLDAFGKPKSGFAVLPCAAVQVVA